MLLLSSEQRYTPARRDLVELLRSAGRPLSIAEMLEIQPAAQSSVYRNLSALEQAGVVRKIPSADDTGRFELAESLTGHHHHLTCRTCGRVVDVEFTAGFEKTFDKELSHLATATGFQIEDHDVNLSGLCASCA